MQIIAATVWNGRISAIFETASELLVAEAQAGTIQRLLQTNVQDASVPVRIRHLAETGANVLICGAICDMYAAMIEARGITVVPFLSGPAQDVLQAYVSGRSGLAGYGMPGCPGRRRNRFRNVETKETLMRTIVMPNQNGTGPDGKGPKTGRNGRRCSSNGKKDNNRNTGAGRGRGGRGRGGSRNAGGKGPEG